MTVDTLTKDESIRLLQAEINRLRDRTCSWTITNEDGWWETDCGQSFEFYDGGPTDNSFTYCPFCGGKLMEVHADE